MSSRLVHRQRLQREREGVLRLDHVDDLLDRRATDELVRHQDGDHPFAVVTAGGVDVFDVDADFRAGARDLVQHAGGRRHARR